MVGKMIFFVDKGKSMIYPKGMAKYDDTILVRLEKKVKSKLKEKCKKVRRKPSDQVRILIEDWTQK